MLTSEDFGAWVQRERRRQRMTQMAVSDKANMTQDYICTLEAGKYKRGPTLDTCNRVLDVLGYELKIVRKKVKG